MNAVKENIQEIKTDIAQIREDVGEIKTTMAVNTSSLEYHIARTDQLQDIVSDFKNEIVKIKHELVRIDYQYKKHLTIVNTAIKVLIALAGIMVFLKEVGLLEKFL